MTNRTRGLGLDAGVLKVAARAYLCFKPMRELMMDTNGPAQFPDSTVFQRCAQLPIRLRRVDQEHVLHGCTSRSGRPRAGVALTTNGIGHDRQSSSPRNRRLLGELDGAGLLPALRRPRRLRRSSRYENDAGHRPAATMGRPTLATSSRRAWRRWSINTDPASRSRRRSSRRWSRQVDTVTFRRHQSHFARNQLSAEALPSVGRAIPPPTAFPAS